MRYHLHGRYFHKSTFVEKVCETTKILEMFMRQDRNQKSTLLSVSLLSHFLAFPSPFFCLPFFPSLTAPFFLRFSFPLP